MKLKEILSFLLCTAILLAFAACNSLARESSDLSNIESNQIPNPWKECTNLEEAASMAGFALELPEFPERVEVMDGEAIQAIYDSDGTKIFARKCIGAGDASGDYNSYPDILTAQLGETEITLKGENGAYVLATWNSDDYSYSVSLDSGVSDETFLTLIEGVR